MKKSIFTAVCSWMLCLGMAAQQNYFTADMLPNEEPGALDGQGGMMVYSPHNDLIIAVTPASCNAIVPARPEQTTNGEYVYKVRADIKADKVKFLFSRRGKALQAEVGCVLKKNCWRTCRVEEVDNPIGCEDQTGSNRFSGKEDMALVEFSSAIQGFKVEPSQLLKCEVTSEQQANNTAVTLVKVMIDSKALKQAREQAAQVEQEFQQLDKRENKTEDEWNRLDELQAKSEQLASQVAEMSQIKISAPNSNVMYIDISDLDYKGRRAYVVMPLTESYEALLATARKYMAEYPSHTESAYYDAAKIAYDKVIEHSDCPIDMREVIRSERDTIASIRKYTYFAEESGRRAQKAEAEQGFESADVYKYLSGRYKFINRLLTYHPEIQGLQAMGEATWEQLSKHPQASKTVQVTTTVQRQNIRGKVTITNPYDPRPLNSLHVNVAMHKDVSKKEARQSSRMVGNVAADGTFSIVMPDGYSYIFIDGEKKAHSVTPDMTTIEIEL